MKIVEPRVLKEQKSNTTSAITLTPITALILIIMTDHDCNNYLNRNNYKLIQTDSSQIPLIPKCNI